MLKISVEFLTILRRPECNLKQCVRIQSKGFIQISSTFLKIKLKTLLDHLQFEYQMKSVIELSNIAVDNFFQNVPIVHKLKVKVKS